MTRKKTKQKLIIKSIKVYKLHNKSWKGSCKPSSDKSYSHPLHTFNLQAFITCTSKLLWLCWVFTRLLLINQKHLLSHSFRPAADSAFNSGDREGEPQLLTCIFTAICHFFQLNTYCRPTHISVLWAIVFASLVCLVTPPKQMDFRDDCHHINSMQHVVLSRTAKNKPGNESPSCQLAQKRTHALGIKVRHKQSNILVQSLPHFETINLIY